MKTSFPMKKNDPLGRQSGRANGAGMGTYQRMIKKKKTLHGLTEN